MSFFTSSNVLAKTYWFICNGTPLRGFYSKMLAHMHILVAQPYKNLSFCFFFKASAT